MAITSGFFNSINSDRLYNADQVSQLLEGLISDGVYEDVGSAFQVTASSGMVVNVGSGRAVVNSKWIKNTAAYPVTLDAAHALLNRWDAIMLRHDVSGREVSVYYAKSTPATTPTKPAPTRDNSYYDIVLAYIYVAAGATAISQSNIEDQRANTAYCGWITGLIKQVNTATLFLQWQQAYREFFGDMETWFETEKSAFDTWFAGLTQELGIMAYVEEYNQKAVIAAGNSQGVVDFNPDGYTYAAGDMFIVMLNGFVLCNITESQYDVPAYTISIINNVPRITVKFSVPEYGPPETMSDSQVITVKVLKSQIGWR